MSQVRILSPRPVASLSFARCGGRATRYQPVRLKLPADYGRCLSSTASARVMALTRSTRSVQKQPLFFEHPDEHSDRVLAFLVRHPFPRHVESLFERAQFVVAGALARVRQSLV